MTEDALTRLLQPGTDPDIAARYATLATRAQQAVFGFEDELAFIDVETTGFDRRTDEIIEVAAVITRGPEIIDTYATLVRPSRPIPPQTTQLTGITDDDVATAPVIEAVIGTLAEHVGTRDLVAHNAAFDQEFLAHAGCGPALLRGSWVDSLTLARIALPRMRSHRLADLAAAFGLAHMSAHRAPDDAEALARLWRIMLVGLSDLPAAVLAELTRVTSPAWPLRRVIAQVAGAQPTAAPGPASAAPALDLKTLRLERLRHDPGEQMLDAADLPLNAPPADAVRCEFTPDGTVGRMYPGYEARDEQSRMAEAVLQAFCSDTHLAVEAGTGVGKSVAYLVPAAHLALANRVAVGVATKTNTLMDQLLYRELPALAEHLGRDSGQALRYVALKGYEHYLCLRKFGRVLADAADAAAPGTAPTSGAVTSAAPGDNRLAEAAMLLAWVAQSSWGDLDAVNLHWSPPLRRAVGASVADCTKKRCRFFPHLCYLHGQRRRAVNAHIVVTNHALLFRDLVADGGILPPVRHWVVDEAHAAEDEARDQLSLGASWTECKGALAALHAKGRGGSLDGLRARVALGAGEVRDALLPKLDEMRDLAAEAATVADSFFDFVKDLGEQRETGYDRSTVRLTPQVRETGAWGTAAGVGRSLAKRLGRLITLGGQVISLLEEAGEEYTDARSDLVGQLTGIAAQLEGLTTVLDGEDDRLVCSVTVNRRRDVQDESLAAALLDVGATLADSFFPRLRSVVFTSATIAAGDDFSHFERSVGLDRLPPETYSTLRLASSYDFERQMTVFVPDDIAEPGSARYLADMERLLHGVHVAMGGSVLTLFTNRREMDELYRRLVTPLEQEGIRLIAQSAGASRKRIADEFLADERVSLFATKSFWEGFDAKGDTLRCVVVTRLPFGQIADPLLEERRERDAGWWEHYYLPEAILELKQAAGRLIRSATDTGCLVLADARLTGQKPYARRFLEALPVQDVERLPADSVIAEIARRYGKGT